MNSKSLLITVLCVLFAAPAFAQNPPAAQGKPPADAGPKISDDEQKALVKINTAPDAGAKLKATTEYFKKYAQSPQRRRVAEHVAGAVDKVADPNQKIALAQQYLATFDKPEEAWIIIGPLLDTEVAQNKIELAFQDGAKYLGKNPEDPRVLVQLAVFGVIEMQKQNQKYVPQAQQYSTKALEILEGDKQPAQMDKEGWDTFRNSSLPKMYQVQGLLAFFSNDKAKAKEKLENAAGLDQSDPLTFAVLGNIYDEEYQVAAKEYQSAPPKLRDESLKKAMEKMDQVIENFARAIAAADGKQQYQAMQQQLTQSLEQYYTFRHQSTKGMKEMIEGFKKKS